jgi:hypothetical protein
MKNYSQKDPVWKNEKIFNSEETIWNVWCYLTSIWMLYNKTPLELNNLALANKKWYKDSLIISSELVALVDWKYLWIKQKPSDDVCIAKTDHYLEKYGFYHFFVYFADGTIVDPLDLNPKKKKNNYNIVEYRHFLTPKNKSMWSKNNYEKIYNETLEETWVEPIFNNISWDNTLTEAETKYLLWIWFARLEVRLNKK